MPIRVLIVDDSALVRNLLAEIINSQSDMLVVGTASDPIMARDKIRQLNPDVLTLDVEMPRMDGLSFLEKLMRLHPMPVVMVSSLTERGAEITLRAMELGAVDFVSKPKIDLANSLADYTLEIADKIRAAARAATTVAGSTIRCCAGGSPQALRRCGVKAHREGRSLQDHGQGHRAGASTGGTAARSPSA